MKKSVYINYMVELRNIQVVGLERSLLAAANSYSSGDINTAGEVTDHDFDRGEMLGGCSTGEGHDSFLKGIVVYMDIKYPQYWTPQMQRYHWMDIMSSQSKMHCLCKNAKNEKEFKGMFNKYVDDDIIDRISDYADNYNNSPKGDVDGKYHWFMKTLSNLPSGYELWMTVKTNYLQLKTVYQQRRMHPLKEDWREGFCREVEKLPMFMDLCGFNKVKTYDESLKKLHEEVDNSLKETETPNKLSYLPNIEKLACETFKLEKQFITKLKGVMTGHDRSILKEQLYWPIINELERYAGFEKGKIKETWDNYSEEMEAKFGENFSKYEEFHIPPFSDGLWSDTKKLCYGLYWLGD